MSAGTLSSLERGELGRLVRSRTWALEQVKRRAKVILMLSAGGSYCEISKRLGSPFFWFSKIQGGVITRGILTSVKGFDRKLIRYIREYSRGAIHIAGFTNILQEETCPPGPISMLGWYR
jgi:hypothetical protein